KGGKKESTDYNDVTIITISNEAAAKSEEKHKDDEGSDEDDSHAKSDDSAKTPPPFTYAFKDKIVIIASDVEVAKQAIRRTKEKQSDCLAGSEDYTNIERACAPVGQIRLFFNLPKIFSLVEKMEKDKDTSEDMSKMGVRDWKAMVGTIRIGNPKGAEGSAQ